MVFFKKLFPALPPVVLLLISLLLIIIWFKDGKLLATGEEGLILANPTGSVELYKYSWNETRSGVPAPGSSTTIPLLYAESYLVQKYIPIWLFQAAIFFVLMFIGSCSIYYLSRELFKNSVEEKDRAKIAFIAGLFYIFNPISLLGVWYRFLLGFMFFYSLVPLFFLLYVFGLNHKKKTFIIIAPIITLLFTFSFGGPAFVLLLWILPFIYSLSLSWSKFLGDNIKSQLFPFIYFGLMLIFWILINLWWIYPYIELSSAAFASEISPTHAIGTLKANSADFTLDNVIRLIHGGFLYRNEAFGSIYKNPIFLLLSWLIPIITIYGAFKLKSTPVKKFLVLSLVLLLFLAKGTSFPLGGVFLWFFSNITFLQAYRNPLEKFGILLPIIYAPLFSFGLIYLLFKIKSYQTRTILLIISVVCLAVNSWPFFTGALAHFAKRDIRVEIPKIFEKANKAIPPGNHIILSVPVMGGSSGFYQWKWGYKGVDASEHLFNYPVVTTFYSADSFYGQLLIAESNGKVDDNLIGVAQIFSADIIAVRHDTDVKAFGYNLDALERVDRMISSSQLTKIFDSAEVSLWSLPQDKIVPVVYTPRSVKFGDSPQELVTSLENRQYDPRSEVFICSNKNKCNPYVDIKQSEISIGEVPEKIEFEKLSPIHYEINITNSKGRFILVFNNSYHSGWIATVADQVIRAGNHIVANGYANGFIVDQKGSFKISLSFEPEKKVAKAYNISLLAVLLGLIILSGSWMFSLFKHT